MNSPPEKQGLLVYTDLDGSLLDHHDYGFEPAREIIECLNREGIPWLLNTSKTLAELLSLRETLHNQHPMIVENGGGIVIPEAYPLLNSALFANSLLENSLPNTSLSEATSDNHASGFRLKTIGTNRSDILALLGPLHQRFSFTGFSNMTAAELCEVTGLSSSQAEQALKREFSEPLLWRDSEEKLAQFQQIINRHSLQLLRGGRFIHVIGNSDKGNAMNWLTALYRASNHQLKTVALGDGENDVAMLEAADLPVLIRSPVHPPPRVQHANVTYTQLCGPAGWREALEALLAKYGYPCSE